MDARPVNNINTSLLTVISRASIATSISFRNILTAKLVVTSRLSAELLKNLTISGLELSSQSMGTLVYAPKTQTIDRFIDGSLLDIRSEYLSRPSIY